MINSREAWWLEAQLVDNFYCLADKFCNIQLFRNCNLDFLALSFLLYNALFFLHFPFEGKTKNIVQRFVLATLHSINNEQVLRKLWYLHWRSSIVWQSSSRTSSHLGACFQVLMFQLCKGTTCMLGLVLEQLAFYILLLVRYNVAVLLHLVKNDKRQYGWGIGSLYFVLSHLCLTLPFVISVANSLCLVLVNFLIHLIFGIYSTSDSGQTQTGKLGYFQFNCPPFFGHFLHQYYSLR